MQNFMKTILSAFQTWTKKTIDLSIGKLRKEFNDEIKESELVFDDKLKANENTSDQKIAVLSDEIVKTNESMNNADAVLNERIKNSVADWNQSDEDADDFVKNRTHYVGLREIYRNNDLNLYYFEDSDPERWGESYNFNLRLENDKLYVVVLDGIAYETRSFEAADQFYGYSLGSDYRNADYTCPFMISEEDDEDGDGIYFMLRTTQNFTSLVIAEKEVVKLDNQYLNIDEELNEESNNLLPNSLVAKAVKTKTYIPVIDSVNGLEYYIGMENGQLVAYSPCNEIYIDLYPYDAIFEEGTEIDTTGMSVHIVRKDGSDYEVNDYICSPVTNGKVVVSYMENGIEFTEELLPIEDVLIDFEYTDNQDGTYTLTGWKGTYNGGNVYRYELAIPDKHYIIL